MDGLKLNQANRKILDLKKNSFVFILNHLMYFIFVLILAKYGKEYLSIRSEFESFFHYSIIYFVYNVLYVSFLTAFYLLKYRTKKVEIKHLSLMFSNYVFFWLSYIILYRFVSVNYLKEQFLLYHFAVVFLIASLYYISKIKYRVLDVLMFTTSLTFIFSTIKFVEISTQNDFGSLNFINLDFFMTYVSSLLFSYLLIYFIYKKMIKFKIILFLMLNHIIAYVFMLIIVIIPNFMSYTAEPNILHTYKFYMLYTLPLIFTPVIIGVMSIMLKKKEIKLRSSTLVSIVKYIKLISIEENDK